MVKREKISAFNFEESANDKMAQILLGSYKIYLDTGGEVSEEMEQLVENQKQKKKEITDEKKLDDFEKIKVKISKLCTSVQSKIEEKKSNPGPEISSAIQSDFINLDKRLKELREIKAKSESREGLWAKFKKGPSEEMKTQRAEDIKTITNYINTLKQTNRGNKIIKDEPSRATELENLEDLSGESGIPGIDISEGLKQIEEKKKEVEEGLKVLVEQLDKLSEHANNFGEELDKQEKLLDGIKTDVEKYDNELGKMNKTMDKVLTAVGGPFRIIAIVICATVAFILIAIGWFLLEFYVFSKL
eukprot:gene12229-5815_t